MNWVVKMHCRRPGKSALIGWLVLLLAVLAPPARAAQLEAINLSYSALVVSGAPFWIAQDLKLFEREGLRSELLYINAGPRAMAAILAGEVQVSLSGVNSIVSAFAQGGDPVALAGTVNTINVSLFARPEIRTAEDLRGKKIGITRFGGLTDVAVVYALKRWNLQPGKDVAIIQIGDASSLLGALAGNSVQAAGLQAPFTIRAAQLGYRELIDLSKSGLQYQNTVVLSTRSFVKRAPETAAQVHARLFNGTGRLSHPERRHPQSHEQVSERHRWPGAWRKATKLFAPGCQRSPT